MLSGLLKKEKKESISIKGNDTQKKEVFQHALFEISQNPEMNLFKVSGAIEQSSIKVEKEIADDGAKKENQSRHINLGKNDYLDKLFNDIKKTQKINTEKNLRNGKEEVFNDTFGQGGTERGVDKENEEQSSNKGNIMQKPQKDLKTKIAKEQERKINSKSIFKKMKKCQTEIIYEKINNKVSKNVSSKKSVNNFIKTGRNLATNRSSDLKTMTPRRCALSNEKKQKRKLSKRPLKKKKINNLNLTDLRRTKINR
jgi:hypothetical protein